MDLSRPLAVVAPTLDAAVAVCAGRDDWMGNWSATFTGWQTLAATTGYVGSWLGSAAIAAADAVCGLQSSQLSGSEISSYCFVRDHRTCYSKRSCATSQRIHRRPAIPVTKCPFSAELVLALRDGFGKVTRNSRASILAPRCGRTSVVDPRPTPVAICFQEPYAASRTAEITTELSSRSVHVARRR